MISSMLAMLWLGCSGGQQAPDAPPAPAPNGSEPFSYEPGPERVPLAIDMPAMESFSLSDGQPPGFPDLRSTGAKQYPLHRIDGRFDLAKIVRPPKLQEVSEVFVLEHEELPNPKKAKRVLKVLRAPLPFPVASDEATFRPTDLRVFIGNEEIPFAKGPAPQARNSTWRINGRALILSHATLPAPGTVRVVYPGVAEVLDRHDPKKAMLDPQDFVQYGLTVQRHTRHGLMLPAPSSGTWELTIPANGRFESFLTMEEPPLSQPVSNGAEVVLSVTVDGETTEVATAQVPGKQRAYTPFTADLGAWAGQQVSVTLATRPKGNAAFDWVFVGSPTISGDPEGEVRRVVVIGLDTTRYDHLSMNGYERPSTPELDAFGAQGFVFDQAWTPAPRTRPSFRSATTGRRPLEPVGAMNIAEVFQDAGFATAGIVANPHLQPRFGFDEGFDSWTFDGRADDKKQVDDALVWLEEQEQRDTYLFLHFMDAHMIYDAPDAWRNRYVEEESPSLPERVKRGEVLALLNRGALDDVQKAQLEALHDGEMAYMDHHLGRFFDALDAMPGKSVVLVHSDHGEEFFEHGGFEHNHTLYDEVTRAVFMLRPKGGLKQGQRLAHPATLADIGPTLYDLVGIAEPPPTDGRSLVPAMRGEADWSDRPIPIAHIQYSHERWGVVWRGKKYILHTGSGQEELYDMAADPGEQHDLSATTDLQPWRDQLQASHSLAMGPGWRVPVDTRRGVSELTLTLPAKARAAGVLDPEAIAEHRANIEWGEIPQQLPADVGSVELSDDGTVVTFTPGPKANGMLYVLFDAPHDVAGASLAVDGQAAELSVADGQATWKQGPNELSLLPGTVIVPPPTEADRMGLGPGAEGGADEMDLLRELGYVGD